MRSRSKFAKGQALLDQVSHVFRNYSRKGKRTQGMGACFRAPEASNKCQDDAYCEALHVPGISALYRNQAARRPAHRAAASERNSTSKGRGTRPACRSAREELADRPAPFFAVIERPAVHVHPDKLVGQRRVHVARELHGVVERGLAMLERIADAFADHARHLAPIFAQRRRIAFAPSGSGKPV